MSMQFCAICSIASTRGLKRISIAIPISSPEISTAVEKVDYEQSLFFLSPSNKTRENAHARD